jgi:hypothetical protein
VDELLSSFGLKFNLRRYKPATRIRIENLCLQTDVFRKMHLEAGTSELNNARHVTGCLPFDATKRGF